jgi:Right handed beta helix region/Protein of unknown function (DUF1565)
MRRDANNVRKRLWSVIVVILCCSALAWSQASVDESLETAHLYVDSVKGSDSNTGTQQLPLRTLGKALSIASANNQKNVGTQVTVMPGTYREGVSVAYGAKATSAPITVEAGSGGAVIISGADIWTGWQAQTSNAGIYTHSWPYDWGQCSPAKSGPFEQAIVLRREMIFINGKPLTQVLSLSQMRVGTFYVDEGRQLVYVEPPSGTNISASTIEVATRSSLLSLTGVKKMVWRGLTFQNASSCRDNAAVMVTGSSSNVLFDSDQFLWNNAQGLHIGGATDATVENSIADYNGQAGLGGYQIKHSLWSSDEASYNNWRGAQGAYYNWNSSGAHFMLMHDASFENLNTSYNLTHGVHWDTDNADITVDSLTSWNNLLLGAFVEVSQGPTAVSNSHIGDVGPTTWPNRMALVLRNSPYVTLSGNTLMGGSTEIEITGQRGGYPVTNWETGQTETLFTQNLTVTENIIQGGSGEQLFSDSSLGGNDWNLFANTLASDYNTWWDGAVSAPFIVPTPRSGSALNFSGWKSLTHQDSHSVFAAPRPSAVPHLAAAGTPDYWFTVDNASQTVKAGDAAAFTVSVSPWFGFDGTVSFSCDGVGSITGAKWSWSQNFVSRAGSQIFKVTTGSSTPKGTYPVTLIAAGSNLTRTVTVSVTVN